MEIIPTFWLAAGLVTLVGVALIWRMGRGAERAVRGQLDTFVVGEVAAWLEARLRRPRAEIASLLTSRNAPEDFTTAYDRHIDFVFLEFERQHAGYFLEIRIEKDGDSLLNVRRRLALDDLPSPVQQAFLRGETRLHVPWHPEFHEPGSAAA
ncbi:MAG: hypothetical protein H0U74_19465 [Bradymonadaceae bacterium]|nr:hypothetical protein [Lujinxingiaceae bacterium]